MEELLAEDVIKQGSTTKKKRKDDGVEGELEDNVEALCDLFENEIFLEKGKVIKVFKEPLHENFDIVLSEPTSENQAG